MPSSAERKTLTMFELRAGVLRCGPSDCSTVGRAGHLSIRQLRVNTNNLARFLAAGLPKIRGSLVQCHSKKRSRSLTRPPAALGPRHRTFQQGRVVEASALHSNAILQRESADLSQALLPRKAEVLESSYQVWPRNLAD
jgi:hypothetical protein